MQQLMMLRPAAPVTPRPLPAGYAFVPFGGTQAEISDWLTVCAAGLLPNTDAHWFEDSIRNYPRPRFRARPVLCHGCGRCADCHLRRRAACGRHGLYSHGGGTPCLPRQGASDTPCWRTRWRNCRRGRARLSR